MCMLCNPKYRTIFKKSLEKIKFKNGFPIVPDNPIVPYIRGDGTGVDIWPATQKVIDNAVKKAYGNTGFAME